MMFLQTASILSAMLSGAFVSATPLDTSLVARQGNPWVGSGCVAHVGGTVYGDKLSLLRQVWNDAFQGDFGGARENREIKGVCCQLQCLYVESRAPGRIWDKAQWDASFDNMAEEVGESAQGLCGFILDEDNYLILFSVYGDSVSGVGGKSAWETIGDTCAGAPGYIGEF